MASLHAPPLGQRLTLRPALALGAVALAALALAACGRGSSVLVGPASPAAPSTPTPGPPSSCDDPEEALHRARPATFFLVARKGTGTSVVIAPHGEAVTAADLVSEGEVVALILPSGEAVAARVAGRHPDTGLALLAMEERGPFPSLPWAPADPQEGERLLVVGYPAGPSQLPVTYSASLFRYLELRGVRYLQVAQELERGFAGAPVVDLCGRLAGIAVARVRDVPRLALAVAASSARQALQTIPPVPPPRRGEKEALLALARGHVVKEGFVPTGLEADLETEDGLLLAIHAHCPSRLYCQNVHFFLNDSYLGTDTLRPSRSILDIAADPDRGWITVTYANYAPGDPDDAPSLPPVTIPYWWDGERLRAGGVPPGH